MSQDSDLLQSLRAYRRHFEARRGLEPELREPVREVEGLRGTVPAPQLGRGLRADGGLLDLSTPASPIRVRMLETSATAAPLKEPSGSQRPAQASPLAQLRLPGFELSPTTQATVSPREAQPLREAFARESGARPLQAQRQERLADVRARTARCEAELRSLAKEEEKDTIDPEHLEEELEQCRRRVTRLEQLAKAPADEVFSDASTSASLAAEDTWQQRAEALQDELTRQCALVTELQDRIHWLKCQLRRQPSLQDKRMQEILQLLCHMAEMVPRDQKMVAIRELLNEIASHEVS